MGIRSDQERATAIQWSLNALRRSVVDLNAMNRELQYAEVAFVTAAHGVWWVRSLDEQCEAFDGAYVRRRQDEDACFGRAVNGLRWLRDRHTHQLVMSAGLDDTDFFPGPPFFLVPNHYSWMRREDLPAGTHRYKQTEEVESDYDNFVGGRTINEPLGRAVLWFESEIEVPTSLLHWASRFTPGVPETHRLSQRDQI